MSTISHIAGAIVEIGPQIRQRCSWCGKTLLDYDMRNLMHMETTHWEVGAIIRIDGNMSADVEHEDGTPVPDDCCASLDPAVTI